MSTPPAPTITSAGFMQSPWALVASWSAGHQGFVQEVYRLAWEQTQAQLTWRPWWLNAFSLN